MNPNNLLARLREWWQAQDTRRKTAFVVAGAAILITLTFLGQILLRPAYAPLFTQLDPAEAGSIVEELESMNVPYRLTNGGKTIEVPENQVYQIRIKLASSGALPGEGKGFELFDEQKFGITEFEQHVEYQRALQEELRRTIVQLDEVEQARVHLVLPKRSLFAEEETTPSASIVLRLKTAARLQPEQVQGIINLVTGAVEGLQPENVHIIDTKGNILNDNLPHESDGITTRQSATRQQLKRDFEKQLETRIQQMLSRIFGPGAAVAMVTAELDFDQKKSTSTIYGPGQVISRQTVTEKDTGSGARGPGGTDGEFSTFPGMTGDNQENLNREEQITNYQTDVYQETLIKSPGEVKRLSVAVVVDQEVLEGAGGKTPSAGQLNQIQRLIASAVGYDATRGDQITVSSMPFDTSLQEVFQEETPAAQKWVAPRLNPWLAGGIAAGTLLLLLILFLLARRIRKRRIRPPEAAEEASPPPPPPEPEPVTPPEPDQRQKIRDLAREKPEEVAEILKLWLKE